jgi:hypothetical protein
MVDADITLRDRIVAALKERAERDTDWMLVDLADAVIAELGLFIQYENGRVVYDTKPAACKANGNWQQRIVGQFEPYITEKQ